MKLIFEVFYRQFGCNRINDLYGLKTKLFHDLPRDSVYHLLDHTEEASSVVGDVEYVRGLNRKIPIDFQTALTSTDGIRMIAKRSLVPEIMLHVKQDKRLLYSPSRDATKVNDPMTVILVDYNMCKKNYSYVNNQYEGYNKWKNLEATRLDRISQLTENSSKQHFIDVPMPIALRPFNHFKQLASLDKVTLQYIRLLSTPEELFFCEILKWLNPVTRPHSLLSRLRQDSYKYINFVFKHRDGSKTVLNLAYIYSWISGSDNMTPYNKIQQFHHEQIQKIFYKFAQGSITLQKQSEQEVVAHPENSGINKHDGSDEEEPDPVVDEGADEYHQVVSGITNNDTPDFNKDIDLADTPNSDFTEEVKSIADTVDTEPSGELVLHEDELYKEDVDTTLDIEVIKSSIEKAKDPSEHLQSLIELKSTSGNMPATEYKKLLKEIGEYDNQKDPYGSSQNVKTRSNITKEEMSIDRPSSKFQDSHLIPDKSMLKSTLGEYDRHYIKNILQKDVLSAIRHIQRGGVIVRNHTVEIEKTAVSEVEVHKIELKPINGAASTLFVKVPKVKPNGTFLVAGSKYTMRKQRVDLPIRKISPTEVALTTYYGKSFVTRAAKKANSVVDWLIRKINLSLINEDGVVKYTTPGNTYRNDKKLPYIYSAMSKHYKAIKTEDYTLSFNLKDQITLGDNKDFVWLHEKGYIVAGYDKNSNPITIDTNDVYSIYKDGKFTSIGNLFDILGIDEADAPVDFTEVKVFTKSVPVGVLLSYYMGFNNLIKHLKCDYEVTDASARIGKPGIGKLIDQPFFVIKFSDKKFYFNRKDKIASLILGGFGEYEKVIKRFPVSEFNTDIDGVVNKDVYFNLFDSKQISSIYIREMDTLENLFVDHITEGILRDMGYPETYKGLLIKATEMLTTYDHPDTHDMSVMRIRGYERIAGAIYKEMAMSIRQFANKNISGRSKIEMSPYQVWGTVMKDPAIKLIEETNPIQNLKEGEIVTYVGEGGRSKDAITVKSRAYSPNDAGIISESTVDSGDTGINVYTSANPNITDIRGLMTKEKELGPANMWSTAVMLSPGADCDDGKRNNFINIQHSHTIATEGYEQPYIRTGYEMVIGNRTSDTFAHYAKSDGVVEKITDKGIIIKHTDGEMVGVTLGRIFGKAEGSVYPHKIVTQLKEGDKFKMGDPIAYNDAFFEPDFFDQKKIIMKINATMKAMLVEGSNVLEDSSSVSPRLSKHFTAETTKVKSIVVNFTQNLVDAVKVGQTVKHSDVLVLIEDEITTMGNFDSDALKELKKLSNQAPLAKYNGVIERIEVLYNGDKSDMTPSLKKLADDSDRILSLEKKSIGEDAVTGYVTSEYRVEGTPLELDKAEIKFYITIRTDVGVGDKIVIANQLKSVNGEVMSYRLVTEDGEEIDLQFGKTSIYNRIVTSPIKQGTTITLLKAIAKNAVKMYKGG